MKQPSLFTQQQQNTNSDDYYTPKWIFDALDCRFHLDVCAPPGGGPFVPCDRYLTREEDGLATDWTGFVWMNPPFSNPTPWVTRFLEHDNGIALLPTSNGRWQDELWASNTYWLTLKSIRFHTPTGPAKSTLPNRCWLVAAGEHGRDILTKSSLGVVR